MKKQILILIIAFGLSACFKSTTKSGDNLKIAYEDIEIKCAENLDADYIINNKDDYQNLLMERSQNSDCTSYTLPTIDFTKNTLLGMNAIVGGCSAKQGEHYITRNNANDTIVFNLDVSKKGLCKKAFNFRVWSLVPKVKDITKIKFKINRKEME